MPRIFSWLCTVNAGVSRYILKQGLYVRIYCCIIYSGVFQNFDWCEIYYFDAILLYFHNFILKIFSFRRPGEVLTTFSVNRFYTFYISVVLWEREVSHWASLFRRERNSFTIRNPVFPYVTDWKVLCWRYIILFAFASISMLLSRFHLSVSP